MSISRALLFGGGQVLAFLVTAAGLGFDFSGISLLGLSSDGLRIMIAVAFGSFVVLTAWMHIESYLRPRPQVVWDGLSPEKSSAMKYDANGNAARRPAYFTRLAFKNKAKNPSGAESMAKAMTALIKIFDSQASLVDSWEGRWANREEPTSYPDKWLADRLDLEANNQQAILDVGLRFEGDLEFHGWDNQFDERLRQGASARKAIKPNCYKLQVLLSASNMKEKSWWFTLNIPQEIQSDSQHVEIKAMSQRLGIHTEGSRS